MYEKVDEKYTKNNMKQNKTVVALGGGGEGCVCRRNGRVGHGRARVRMTHTQSSITLVTSAYVVENVGVISAHSFTGQTLRSIDNICGACAQKH